MFAADENHMNGAGPAGSCAYRAIVALALPMMLSMTGHTVMSFLDGVFLARYSREAIAALGPAGMASWLIISFFSGAAGYTATFVAQYRGAGVNWRIGASVWHGLYFALGFGVLILFAGMAAARWVFMLAGHSAALVPLEAAYFKIACMAAPAALAGSALSGFFTGLGRMKTLMAVQVAGQSLNALLDYAMIFGRLGFPEMGIKGAAVASLAAQSVIASVLFLLVLGRKNRSEFMTWSGRGFDRQLFCRFFTYGIPNGLRFFFEMLAWTAFLFFIGRIGGNELAATNIAWRINMFAFFPMIGLSIAVGIIVGHAQGAGKPDVSAICMRRGLVLAQIWMVAWGCLFVLAPGPLVALFGSDVAAISRTIIVLLRFVAVYCLLDGINVVLVGGLQGAGDTRWTMIASVCMHSGFIALLAVVERCGGGLYGLWWTATVFVMVIALLWLYRFLSGRWRHMRVIEDSPAVAAPCAFL